MGLGVALATLFASGFVLLMWVFKDATQMQRDDEQTIYRRFKTTVLVSLAAVTAVALVQPNSAVPHLQAAAQAATLPKRLGLTCAPYVWDLPYTVFLNSCLFLGPLVQMWCEGGLAPTTLAAVFWSHVCACFKSNKQKEDLLVARQYFMGPLTEEIVYRMAACYFLYFSGMLPLSSEPVPPPRTWPTAKAFAFLCVDSTQRSETGQVRGLRWHNRPREWEGKEWCEADGHCGLRMERPREGKGKGRGNVRAGRKRKVKWW